MMKKMIAFALALIMAMSLPACRSSNAAEKTAAPATEKESTGLLGVSTANVHLRVGTTTAPDGHYVLGLVAMQKKLEELSGGTMTLDIYPNSALGGESDMMDAVSMGTQDMVLSSTGPIPSFSNKTANWATLDLPYLFETAEDAYAVFDSEVGAELLAGFDGTGIKAVGIWENGFRQLTNEGKNAVVIGRSLVVGKPAAMMLMAKNATVTICHTKTVNTAEICKNADIIVSAAGVLNSLTKDYVRPGQVVIDVSMNWNPEKVTAKGKGGMSGDCVFEEVEPIVDAITPVPGGVGAVTTSVLMKHVVEAAERG